MGLKTKNQKKINKSVNIVTDIDTDDFMGEKKKKTKNSFNLALIHWH